jgi:hypothetical protein
VPSSRPIITDTYLLEDEGTALVGTKSPAKSYFEAKNEDEIIKKRELEDLNE